MQMFRFLLEKADSSLLALSRKATLQTIMFSLIYFPFNLADFLIESGLSENISAAISSSKISILET